jgi:hypothetical protein
MMNDVVEKKRNLSFVTGNHGFSHRYLISRLSLQVVYLWHHVSSTAPLVILWWSNLEILFGPLHHSSPFIGELRCQAIQMEHGPYIAERTQKAVYIVRFLWGFPIFSVWTQFTMYSIYCTAIQSHMPVAYPVPGSLDKKAEEDATFCLIKDVTSSPSCV